MNRVERLFFLKQISPFSYLRDSELAIIADAMQWRAFLPETVLLSRDRRPSKLYLITKGSISSDQVIHDREKKFIGFSELVHDLPMPSSILADSKTGCETLSLTKSQFHTVASECPLLIYKFILGDIEKQSTRDTQ